MDMVVTLIRSWFGSSFAVGRWAEGLKRRASSMATPREVNCQAFMVDGGGLLGLDILSSMV